MTAVTHPVDVDQAAADATSALAAERTKNCDNDNTAGTLSRRKRSPRDRNKCVSKIFGLAQTIVLCNILLNDPGLLNRIKGKCSSGKKS